MGDVGEDEFIAACRRPDEIGVSLLIHNALCRCPLSTCEYISFNCLQVQFVRMHFSIGPPANFIPGPPVFFFWEQAR